MTVLKARVNNKGDSTGVATQSGNDFNSYREENGNNYVSIN